MKLWLDAHAYGRSLLWHDREPWDEPASVGRFAGELCHLLRPWRLVMPLAPLLLAGSDRNGSAAERAEAFDIKARSPELRNALTTAVDTLVHSGAAGCYVPMLPGPSTIAPGLADEDMLDDLVASLGDILRIVGAAAAEGIVLVDEADGDARDCLAPLGRVAEHSGARLWIVGDALPRIAWDRLDIDIASQGLVTIPQGANPEAVLETLGRLRNRGE
ncbi:hypothetical protein NT2_05_01930 [Caenibius tardaugens NBRC 16725]|uniref:Uncharacterized protein n=1 Tax=Caenibius tardaugens NBRC 16725 TaxID=1219035 RepID=U3A3E6_9SPHN|nr:hypothetical protein [Caenibius tardaugens]AZI36620.1 hypothetical protein EGO55_12205 [Caenibius tardaugens NBRC 16725]GAD49273.1 hypothetical protein NT2_05_01930 [Caenibius tardaugens NBRC 16725]